MRRDELCCVGDSTDIADTIPMLRNKTTFPWTLRPLCLKVYVEIASSNFEKNSNGIYI